VDNLFLKACGCRGDDPREDTERRKLRNNDAIHGQCCRGDDPREDTERTRHKVKKKHGGLVVEGTIRERILKGYPNNTSTH
jgi:hypothetical protein